MRNLRRSLVTALLLTLALSAVAAAKPPAAAPAPPLPLATPESQGMSSERLGRLHAEIDRFVSEGKYAGAVSLIARNGRVVDWQAWGKRDIEAGLPMEKDTICRIYSMSKIVTSVAALILLEEARFKLDDPVGDYLPELAHMKVLTGGTAEKPLLADAKTPITIKHLFTHTSGLTYDGDTSPVEKLNRDAKLPEATSLADFVRRVSLLPLAYEPGERFTYSVSIDVLGALVEKVSGRPFGEFLEERLFRPLGMKDTGFSVPRREAGTAGEDLREGRGREAPAGEAHLRHRAAAGTEAGGRRGRPLLDDGRLRAVHADAAERRRARRGPDPLPKDRRADDGQPPQPHATDDPPVERVRRIRPRGRGSHRPREGERARLGGAVRLERRRDDVREPRPEGEDGGPPVRAALPPRRAQDLLAVLDALLPAIVD